MSTPRDAVVAERDIVMAPDIGPKIVKPHKTMPAYKALGDSKDMSLGDCVLRTCTTCDCFRGDPGGDGYCHHAKHFEEYGSEQFIGSFHGIKNGFQPQICPIAKTDDGLWQPGIWWDYKENDYERDETISSR